MLKKIILLGALIVLSCTENPTISDEEESVRGSISGIVKDINNNPIIGVDVSTDSAGYNTVSDTSGNYTIPDVREGEYTVTFTKEGYYDSSITVAIVKSELKKNINMNLIANNGVIKGIVTDDSSNGLIGVSVTVQPGGYSSTTVDSGKFELSNIPHGEYVLTVSVNGFSTVITDTINLHTDTFTVVDNIMLTPLYGSVSGVVKDDSSNGINGVLVSTIPEGFTTTTNDTGGFSFSKLPFGKYMLNFSKVNYNSSTSDTFEIISDTIAVAVNGKISEILGTITGIVTDDSGNVLSGVSVTTSPKGYSTNTISDGSFTISDISLGNYVLYFSFSDYASKISDTLTLDTLNKIDTVNVSLEKIVGKVTGTIVDDSGKALSGVTITSEPKGYTTISDSTGFYELSLGELGKYRLRLGLHKYQTTYTDSFTITADSNNLVINDTMSLVYGSITGTVKNDSGKALSGVSVTVSPGGYTTVSDTSGYYEIADIQVDTYSVTFIKGNFKDSVVSNVIVNMDSLNVTFDVNMVSILGSITGIVKNDSGAVLSGVSITVSPGGFTTVTDTAGKYEIINIPVNTYNITFLKSIHKDTVISDVVLNVDTLNVVVDLQMVEIRGSVSGTVRESNGNRLGGVDVTLSPGGLSARTDAYGEYKLERVAVGDTFSITFSKNNFRDSTVGGYALSLESKDTVIDATLKSDITYTERDVTGKLNGDLSGNAIAKIVAVLKGDSISEASGVVTELQWSDSSSTYSGFIMRPEQGLNWTVEVKVYDSNNRITGYKKLAFDTLIGDISMPEFNAQNATPQISITSLEDSTFYIDDTVYIPFSVTDIDGNGDVDIISNLEYKSENDATFKACDNGMISFIAPDIDDGKYNVIIKAVDSDGNTRYDTTSVKLNLWSVLLPQTGGPSHQSSDSICSIFSSSDGSAIYLRVQEKALYGKSFVEKVDRHGYNHGRYVWDTTAMTDMILLSDGNYLVSGQDTTSGKKWVISKISESFNLIWEKRYGNVPNSPLESIAEASDGSIMGCFVSGNKTSVIKLNNIGDSLFTKELEGDRQGAPYKIIGTSDNSFIIAGVTTLFGNGVMSSAWIGKINTNADTIWNNSFSVKTDNIAYSIVELSDGSFGVTGYTDDWGSEMDLLAIKVSSIGSEDWIKSFDGQSTFAFDKGFDVVANDAGGFVIAGKSVNSSNASDIWVLSLDSSGDTLWTERVGGAKNEEGHAICRTSGGGYLLGGFAESYNTHISDNKDPFIFKIGKDGSTSNLPVE